jgi:drug/metabolite transporter (DMT)-like permease
MIGANLGLLFTAFAWATQIAAFNILLENWDPYFLAPLRYAWAVPVLLLILKVTERGPLLPSGVSWSRLWLLGAFGIGFFSPVFVQGLNHSNPVTAAIFASAAPAVAAVVERVFFKMPIDRYMIPAILLAVVGCVLATYDPTKGGQPFDLHGGEPLLVIAAGMWAWYSVAAQRWLAGWSQLRISVVTLVPGTCVAIAVYVVAGLLGFADFPPNPVRSTTDIGLHAWVTLACVSAGFVFWNNGVRVLGVVVASVFLNMVPIFAVAILAYLGHPPTWTQLAGGALVVLGLVQAQLRQISLRRSAAAPAEPVEAVAQPFIR